MDPLDTLMRPLASVLNRNIRDVTRARELCAQLAGTAIAVRVSGTGLAASFVFESDAVALTASSDRDPDVVISGSPLSLAKLAQSGGENVIRSGRVDLTGNVETAQAFQALLAAARPDIEEELSRVIGDVAAHGLGEFARGVSAWAHDARTTMGDNVREYLQEESGNVPTREEIDAFAADVNTLRDDVERAAARLDRLQGRD